MSVYNVSGNAISNAYNVSESALTYAYDVNGNEVLSGGQAPEDPFVKTLVRYDTNYIITSAWLENAETQRDACKTAYSASDDAIPFFIMTDGHGKYNEGNKGCHNLAEQSMRYIFNIQLGDYASYYSDGANPSNHAASSLGLTNYISAMGNHEFANNSSADAELADLPTLIGSYTPSTAILGSETYGFYKLISSKYNVKFLVTQPHIPDENDSAGFIWKITGEQYEWLIDELEADDGYDIVVVQHEPLNGTYTNKVSGTTYTYNIANISIGEILSARKAKQSGSYTDSNNVVHPYDFTSCTTDILCSLHGHHHAEAYMTKATLGFPSYVADDFDNVGTSVYGLIDRDNGKLKLWKFSSTATSNVFELDL